MWISPRSLRFGSIRGKANSISHPRFAGGQMKGAISIVASKGLVTIPSTLRQKFGIRKGTRVSMIEEGTRIVLQPLTREYIRGLRGSLRSGPSALNYLFESRKHDREL
jgi:AbrB family looped-hinge helix DNA binding protein